MRFIKLFENFESEKPKSKTQIKREFWCLLDLNKQINKVMEVDEFLPT